MRQPTTTATTQALRVSDSSLRRPTLRVFVLVGQSNMVGHGACNTTDGGGNSLNGALEWLVRNVPEQYEKLQQENGEWTERSDIWVANNREQFNDPSSNIIHQYGTFSACGYGGDPGQTDQMGPEVGFGWTIGDYFRKRASASASAAAATEEDRVLLLKLAWGGKSLAVDFLSPMSAIAQGVGVGPYYHSVITTVLTSLAHVETYVPSTTATSHGRYAVQLSGFVWHQGWNDGCDEEMVSQHESNLANLIRDIRNDLSAPDLPVSIGVSGMVGYRADNGLRQEVVRAQFAVANTTRHPELVEGTVTAVETRDFVRKPAPHSPSNFNFHWMNNCESYWLVGQAMGKAMIQMIRQKELRREQDKISTKTT